jgi:nucleoside-diphosphate-sugar epimerase
MLKIPGKHESSGPSAESLDNHVYFVYTTTINSLNRTEMMELTGSHRALVTGGTGFVGSHLVDLLLRKGYDVTCLVRDPERLRWLKGRNVTLVRGDCSDTGALADAVSKVATVYHLAGLTKTSRTREFYEVNHLGTRNILEACAKHNPGLKRFVLMSSLAAAGPSRDGRPVREADVPHPVSDYGKSKLLAEQETQKHKERFSIVVLRPSAVYGPRDTDMYELFRWASRGVMLDVAGGDRFINPCYVEDLAAATLFAGVKDVESGSIYFVAENRVYSWNEFRNTLFETGGVSARVVRFPYPAAYLVGLVYEIGGLVTGRAPIMNRQKVREAAQKYWICDVEKTERELGFEPAYPLERGLTVTWQWYRDRKWL